MRHIIILILIGVTVLVGCQRSDDPDIAQIEDNNTISVAESVSPISTPVSPVIASNAFQDLASAMEDPIAGFATVGGILLMDNPSSAGSYTPVPRAPVFLAPIIRDDKGQVVVAGLDQDRDPSTSTGQTGVFIFQNVPAGEYGLVVMHGVNLYLVENDAGESYIVTVEADRALDLGEIHANLPEL